MSLGRRAAAAAVGALVLLSGCSFSIETGSVETTLTPQGLDIEADMDRDRDVRWHIEARGAFRDLSMTGPGCQARLDGSHHPEELTTVLRGTCNDLEAGTHTFTMDVASGTPRVKVHFQGATPSLEWRH